MGILTQFPVWTAAVLAFPAAGYAGMYCALRLAGKLRVNHFGWHAENLSLPGGAAVEAIRLFGVFQPLMRVESSFARWVVRVVGGGRHRDEPAVSEVVVELVSLV